MPEQLFDHLQEQPVAGQYHLNIENSQKTNRKARKAIMELKYKQVEIKRPTKASKDIPKTLKLYVVEAKESNTTVPKGERRSIVLWVSGPALK